MLEERRYFLRRLEDELQKQRRQEKDSWIPPQLELEVGALVALGIERTGREDWGRDVAWLPGSLLVAPL